MRELMLGSWALEIGKRLRTLFTTLAVRAYTNYQLPITNYQLPKSIVTLHFFIFLTAITAISVKHFGVP
ncbi:hypothetical protein [Mastigocoleus testarum]|uniref:Uncharacterized protein n=1 Tax=Mastigocoleus testarum BC008 TaxID=371196 RepID=A0A0V7ZKU6_9CYAN|nr:hypothetical protein [Mastigocoleus testarum]KST65058.1 hypothetical protein BC008_19845 [Mastigocoleus testarum BC008]